MYYHVGRRLLYLAHPRTASQATAAALMDIGFEKMSPGDHHMRLWDAHLVTQWNRSEWIVFTAVRNHFDALVSWVCKRYRNRSGPIRWDLSSFETALRANTWVGQHELWARHSEDADIILRYESLERGLRAVVGLRIRLPKVNVSEERNGRPYRDFYTDETRDYVTERFSDEIRRFGYGF